LAEVENIFNQILLFVPFPQEFSRLLDRFERLWSYPVNPFPKSFLIIQTSKMNEECYFMQKKISDLMSQDILDWTGIK
jgi:hypothetical protein